MGKRGKNGVSRLRIYLAVLRAMIYGLEDRRTDEMVLQQVLREATHISLFDLAAFMLGRYGTIFSLPTLMAFSDAPDRKRQLAVAEAKLDFLKRVKVSTSSEMLPMFRQEWWKISWIAPPQHFVTMALCIAQLYNPEDPAENIVDEVAELLLKEIDVPLLPYQNFYELRLTTGMDVVEQDLKKLNMGISQDMLLNEVTDDGTVSRDSGGLIEENQIFMRCDYLLSRLRLPGNFKDNLYLLKNLLSLNVREH